MRPWSIISKCEAGLRSLKFSPTRRMVIVGIAVLVLDQITKRWVLFSLGYAQQLVVLEGFFKIVHWGNTGAAWSLFYGYNKLLASVAVLALIGLFFSRHHFDLHTTTGQFALGCIFGGISGNLIDRIHVGHVVDFVRFYLVQRNGQELGFPAFNVADAAICSGVTLIFFQSLRESSSDSSTRDSSQA